MRHYTGFVCWFACSTKNLAAKKAGLFCLPGISTRICKDYPLFLHFLCKLFRNGPTWAILLVGKVPFHPLPEGRIRRHFMLFMPLLINFHTLIFIVLIAPIASPKENLFAPAKWLPFNWTVDSKLQFIRIIPCRWSCIIWKTSNSVVWNCSFNFPHSRCSISPNSFRCMLQTWNREGIRPLWHGIENLYKSTRVGFL